MENFKEIAEKCLINELSGTFVLRNKLKLNSKHLTKPRISAQFLCPYDILTHSYSEKGSCYHRHLHLVDYDIIDFILDNMKEQIKIDIPEGKVPVMEQTEKGVVITWKEKELTYDEIYEHLHKNKVAINYFVTKGVVNNENESFLNKTNILRKLINIRNYFGGDKPTNLWTLTIDSALHVFSVSCRCRETNKIYFDTQEHAEQAIKMLGDELKYLFEPW